MSLSRCIDIEINGVQYPFHFGMSTILKFSKAQKWDTEPAIDILSRLMTVSGSQKVQSDFFKISATAGAAYKGTKPPTDTDIEDSFFMILKAAQGEAYPALMSEMGFDVKPMLDKVKNTLEKADDVKP